MTTPWVSPLVSLPADGAVVFIRRLRWFDTPVLATWDEAAGVFRTGGLTTLNVTGGSYAGSYTATLLAPIPGTGFNGWGLMFGGIFVGTIESPPGTWQFQQTDLVANAYSGAPYAAPARPHTSTLPTVVGAPGWTGPTSMDIDDPATPVEVPAWGVNSWRPQ